MKFILIKNFFVLLFFILLSSCKNLNNQYTSLPNNENNNACKLKYVSSELKSDIWEISKEGQPTSYIVGSLNFRKENDKLPDRIKRIIPSIDLVVTEWPLNENPKYSRNTKFKEYIDSMTYETPQLESIIGSNLYFNIIKFHEKNTNLNSTFINNNINYVKPWFFVIELPRYLIRKNFSYDTGYESLVYLEADSLKKQFDFLEDKSVIPSLLFSIENDHIIAQINRFIKYDYKISNDLNKMYKAFNDRKYAKLIKLENKYISDYFDDNKVEEKFWTCFYVNELLENRNNIWNNKILDIISKKRSLIVVSFFRLFSQAGIIDFLKSQGYKVEPLYY